MSHTIDNEEVSELWWPLLKDLREVDHVDFTVNEGRRTMARQNELFAQNMQFVGGRWQPKPGHALTAFPSATAPHIRTGRPDHAIDFRNAQGVIDGAMRRGVTLRRTVLNPDGSVREEWHLEIASVAQVEEYNRRRQRKIAALFRRVKKTKHAWRQARAAYRRRTGR